MYYTDYSQTDFTTVIGHTLCSILLGGGQTNLIICFAPARPLVKTVSDNVLHNRRWNRTALGTSMALRKCFMMALLAPDTRDYICEHKDLTIGVAHFCLVFSLQEPRRAVVAVT